MTRATYVLAGTTLVGMLTSVWLYLDNRWLRGELADRPIAPAQTAAADRPAAPKDPWLDAKPQPRETGPRSATIAAAAMPTLPSGPVENRNDRRARRTAEFSAMFGRAEGETEEEYRQRVMPLVTAGLTKLRNRTTDMRRAAEEKAGVTKEQSAALDQTFDKAYTEVIDYANEAIGDGRLSPYKRDVGNWLEMAGGLGTMLNGVQGQIGKILSPSQIKAMYDSGFEWGEYLGANAPWERLRAPPPAPR
jgi:hypothetical protein